MENQEKLIYFLNQWLEFDIIFEQISTHAFQKYITLHIFRFSN